MRIIPQLFLNSLFCFALVFLCCEVVSGSGTALVPEHTGTDYSFSGNYSSGQITINGSGSYYLTDNLTASSSVYGIQIGSGSVILDGDGKSLSGIDGNGINITSDGDNSVITNFSGISGFVRGVYSAGNSVTISDNTVFENDIGIDNVGNYGEISRNTIYGNRRGILSTIISVNYYAIKGSNGVVITDNVVYQNDNGIVSMGNYARITDNRVFENTIYGINAGGVYWIGHTDPGTRGSGYYANITGNTVYDNDYCGLYSFTPNARILENSVYDNSYYGIYLSRGSTNTTVMNNSMVNNTYGLQVMANNYTDITVSRNTITNCSGSGVYFSYSDSSSEIGGNGSIFDNYFANTVNVGGFTSIRNFTWTNPSGPVPGINVMGGPNIAGNYWSSPDNSGWSDTQSPEPAGYTTVPYGVLIGSGSFDTYPLVRVGQIINSFQDIWTINYPHGNITYPRYANATYITQAKPGATLEDLIVDGSSVEFSPEYYTFTNLTQDHTIHTLGTPTPGQVHAFFTVNTTWGAAPLTVSFTNQSIGNPTSFFWDLGDGTSSTDQNPVHTYTTPGIFTVTLRASNNQTRGVAILNNAVTVTAGVTPSPTQTPVPGEITTAFLADQTAGSAPLQVTFSDYSTGNPTSWLWNLGDGNLSTLQNVTHIYSVKGSYSVTLSAQNSLSTGSMQKNNYIRVG